MATIPKVLTYEEWLKLPEAEGVEEVVNGEVRRTAPGHWNHTRIIEGLARQLRAQLNQDTVYVVTSVFGLVIRREPLTTRVPDLAVVRSKSTCGSRRLHSFRARTRGGGSFTREFPNRAD